MRATHAVRILILNHRGGSVRSLITCVKTTGADFDLLEPEAVKDSSRAEEYDGVIASGGCLRAGNHRDILRWYSDLLSKLNVPFLGICLGLRILGYCYGARMRKIPLVVGSYTVRFHREFPLAPTLRECTVYESHRYELIPPLPETLDNYASNTSRIQAVKVKAREQYGVQFHPEVGETPAGIIIKNFTSICD